jgi:acetyl esterase/lipase
MIIKTLSILLCFTALLKAAEVEVYLLGGQSNMQGSGELKNLHPELKTELKNVFFFSDGKFEPFEIGKTKTSNNPASFGPELGFSKVMTESGKPIYLIKYAVGGMPLHHGWDAANWLGGEPSPGRTNFYPGKNLTDPNMGKLYKAMIEKYLAGIKSLTDAGESPVVKGFLWMQGEQDSKNEPSANSYDQNLNHLISRIKQDLNLDRLPCVFGQVLPAENHLPRFTHRSLIREKMAAADMSSGLPSAIPLCKMISTDGFPLLEDTVHYNADGLYQMGVKMADEIKLLENTGIEIQLWGDKVPGFPDGYKHKPYLHQDPERITETSRPFMSVYPAIGKPNGNAIIIFPGGAYWILAYKKEGSRVAAYFASKGFTCFVAHYRVTKLNNPAFQFPGPLLDARQSIRLVKSMAEKYGFNAGQVGVLGFSAGGHLASMCATRFEDTFPEEAENMKGDLRPSFAALIYPVASMIAIKSHSGSRNALFGNKPDENELIAASPERRVKHGYPPIFIAHKENDGVDAKLSIALAEACKKVNVPCTLHLFPGSEHGFGMGSPKENAPPDPAYQWPQLLIDFINENF